jgi:hypothetical protein
MLKSNRTMQLTLSPDAIPECHRFVRWVSNYRRSGTGLQPDILMKTIWNLSVDNSPHG